MVVQVHDIIIMYKCKSCNSQSKSDVLSLYWQACPFPPFHSGGVTHDSAMHHNCEWHFGSGHVGIVLHLFFCFCIHIDTSIGSNIFFLCVLLLGMPTCNPISLFPKLLDVEVLEPRCAIVNDGNPT
jgi:hypothetical protein